MNKCIMIVIAVISLSISSCTTSVNYKTNSYNSATRTYVNYRDNYSVTVPVGYKHAKKTVKNRYFTGDQVRVFEKQGIVLVGLGVGDKTTIISKQKASQTLSSPELKEQIKQSLMARGIESAKPRFYEEHDFMILETFVEHTDYSGNTIFAVRLYPDQPGKKEQKLFVAMCFSPLAYQETARKEFSMLLESVKLNALDLDERV